MPYRFYAFPARFISRKTALFLCCLSIIGAGALYVVLGGLQAQSAADRATQAQQLFNEGNYYYEQRDYMQAIAFYTQIERSGFISAELFLNAGLAHLQLQETGHALYYFTKAREKRPDWRRAEQAITFTQDQLEQQGRAPELNTFSLYASAQKQAGNGASFLWALLLANAAAVSLMLHWFGPASLWQKGSRYACFGLFTGALFCMMLGIYLENSARTWQPGLVVENGYNLYEQPDEHAERLLAIPAGSRFYMNRTETREAADPAVAQNEEPPQAAISEWLYIQHSSGARGWISAEAVRLLP